MGRYRIPLPTTLDELYARAVLLPSTRCLTWNGRMVRGGYGQIGIGRTRAAELGIPQTVLVHRLAWELANGPIPEGMQIDHRCRNRACVNVAHMQVVTPQENVRRGLAPVLSSFRLQQMRALERENYKTHCVHGHPLTEDNIYTDKRGFRACRECGRIRARAFKKQRLERRLLHDTSG